MTEEIDSTGPVGAVGQPDYSVPGGSAQPGGNASPVRPAPPRPQAGPSAVTQSPPAPASAESIRDAVRQINQHLASANRILQLRTDAVTGLTVAEVRNAATGEVIQQIPSTDMIHLAQMLYSWTNGRTVLVDLLA